MLTKIKGAYLLTTSQAITIKNDVLNQSIILKNINDNGLYYIESKNQITLEHSTPLDLFQVSESGEEIFSFKKLR